MTDHFSERTKYCLFRAAVLLMALLLPVICLSADVPAAPGYEHVAKDTAGSKQISLYGMTPVYGTDIENGTYEVTLKSSSKYFRVSEASLQVQDGQMQVTFTLESHAYEYVFPGTGEEAAKAAMEHGLKSVEVFVKGPGSGREAAIRALNANGLDIISITDVTPVPHNGCRPPKRRRV